MKIGIVGWGLEGQSAFGYFGPEHEYLIVNEEPRDNFPPRSDKVKVQFNPIARQPGVTGNVDDLSYLNGIEGCDKIIYTPTAIKNLQKVYPPDSPFWQKATTVQHIFFEEVKTKNIIGVTGSKGKGTTSTLIAMMLEAAKLKVYLGGNIGLPPLDFIKQVQPSDWVVLELTNFQLYNFPYSPHIGVCLMVTSEHLDWHPDIEDYLAAKANLFSHQTKDDIAIYLSGDQNSQQIVGSSPGKKIPFFEPPGAYVIDDNQIVIGPEATPVIKTSQLKLVGRHNWQNVCAALSVVWQISQDLEAFKEVLSSFSGLEHRLEFVRELDHVSYWDDSFGTTPDTAIVALKAFVQPAVIILGGHDKGLPFDELIEEVAHRDRVRHVITIGQIGPAIAKALRDKHFMAVTESLDKMPDIVAEARARAQPGDVVLLSCGTSSFGLFRDYKDRGNQFKQAVLALS